MKLLIQTAIMAFCQIGCFLSIDHQYWGAAASMFCAFLICLVIYAHTLFKEF